MTSVRGGAGLGPAHLDKGYPPARWRRDTPGYAPIYLTFVVALGSVIGLGGCTSNPAPYIGFGPPSHSTLTLTTSSSPHSDIAPSTEICIPVGNDTSPCGKRPCRDPGPSPLSDGRLSGGGNHEQPQRVSAPVVDGAHQTPTDAPDRADPSITPTDPRHSAYVTAADAACVQASRQLREVGSATSPSDLVATLARQLVVQQNTLSALEHLVPAATDRGRVDSELLEPLRLAIPQERNLLPAVSAAILSDDYVQIANLHHEYDELSHPAKATTFVKHLGLSECEAFEYFRPR